MFFDVHSSLFHSILMFICRSKLVNIRGSNRVELDFGCVDSIIPLVIIMVKTTKNVVM